MYKIRNLILPFFPESKWLKDRWWHRLSLVISYLWAGVWGLVGLLVLYFFISSNINSYSQVQNNIRLRQQIQSMLNKQNRQYDYESAYKNGYSYEEIFEFLATNKDGANKPENQPRDWTRAFSKDNDVGIKFKTDFTLFFISLPLLIVGIFTPSLIYRVFLYIVTNNKWKQEKD